MVRRPPGGLPLPDRKKPDGFAARLAAADRVASRVPPAEACDAASKVSPPRAARGRAARRRSRQSSIS